MKTISILTPTRGRPERMRSFIESVITTASSPDRLEFLNYIDEDDSKLEEYQDALSGMACTNIIGRPISVSRSWNDLANRASGDILVMGNDDLIYRTRFWDIILEEEVSVYRDDIYCAWFEDLINGEKHCAFPIVSRRWYETLGYFTPGIFNFGYNDTWIFDLAKRIGRTHFIPGVVNEHMHFSTDKAEFDDTYARNRVAEKGNLYVKDKVIFDASEVIRAQDASRLANLLMQGDAA